MDKNIHIYKSEEEFEYLRKAGRLAAKVLDETCKRAKVGVSTWELDQFAEQWIRQHDNCIPTFKGYLGFPASICVAINNEVVHGIPSKEKILREGDIISIDIGVTLEGRVNGSITNFVGDNARTVAVGEVSDKITKLTDATQEGLWAGIKMCKAGNKISDVAKAIEEISDKYRYGSVKEFGGHGIGPKYHALPFIPNYTEYFRQYADTVIEKGMVLAIEPMFTLGLDQIRKLKDDWTIVTKDNKHAAHYEHSLLVTDGEPEILTVLE